ncbi:Hachiman antiphage defense system protein HamA [Actinomadura sp. WMMB 499]|uniref:Hachiman antiphage defense system protein HamA n=1 Tax=Actinomadura sp. WMMB 499 TaxID=1219491 RepID=UPI00159E522F|nr:Hachiman antiphage defense system protein HamA [Actinomadura sp. WMMB 499]
MRRAAADIDAFDASVRPVPRTADELLVLSTDQKGVVMRLEALWPATAEASRWQGYAAEATSSVRFLQERSIWGWTVRENMADFSRWCTMGTLVSIGDHRSGMLESYDDATGVATVVAIIPDAYAEPESLALLASRLGKEGVAKFLRNKLPTKPNARSGDMGEILATAYLHDECGYVVGPSRLIQRDHQEWAMRGDDVLGASLDSDGKPRITKAEAKSRVSLGEETVKEARKGLARNDELPSPHSLTQFAERLLPTADSRVGEAVLTMQLSDGVRPDRVGHLLFLFTASDPSTHVAADLKAYSGSVSQLTITLRVKGHQKFIKDAYDGVTTGGA